MRGRRISPGAVALGNTIDQTVNEMHEATAFHLEGLLQAGEPLPEPSGTGT